MVEQFLITVSDSALLPSFNMAEILLYTFGAVLFIADFGTDSSVLKTLLWIPSLYAPCLTFILLPILVNLPQNVKRVKQMQWNSWKICFLNSLKVPVVLAGFTPVLQIVSTAMLMLSHRKHPTETLYRSTVVERSTTNHERLVNIAFETVPQLLFQMYVVRFFYVYGRLYRSKACIPVSLEETCPTPMFTCGNVCFPQMLICNNLRDCYNGSTCQASTAINSPLINVTGHVVVDDESTCSELDLFLSSDVMVRISMAVSVLSIVWVVVSTYNTSWLMFNINNGIQTYISWKLFPVLVMCVSIFLTIKMVAGLIFLYSLHYEGYTYLYLIGIYCLYMCAHMLLVLYAKSLCTSEADPTKQVNVGNMFVYVAMLTSIPCYNLIALFPTNRRFHLVYYAIEYVKDICFYFCLVLTTEVVSWDQSDNTMVIHVCIYSAVFVFGLVLYGIFVWLIGPTTNRNVKFIISRLFRYIVRPKKSNKVNVTIIEYVTEHQHSK